MTDADKPLAGRAALITGANRGLGLEIARAYLAAGASVALCARDADALAAAADELTPLAGEGQAVFARATDVTRADDVQALVDAARAALGGLHVLVSNAGIYGPFGVLEDADWAAWVRAVEVNLHGSVLPMRAVLPHFKAQGYGKIIQLSGGGATKPMPRFSAYAASKAAIARLAETVAEECKGLGIDVNSIAPGALNTRLLDELLAAGPDQVGAETYAGALRQKEQGGAPLAAGAALAVFLASAASDGITGRLISAIWDNWPDLPRHRDDLARSDVYTLRRITGRDRGLDWGDK
jgi:NAD(P)-dependent dehydrogenase (short-subunit alcohol dehydrogenase family)